MKQSLFCTATILACVLLFTGISNASRVRRTRGTETGEPKPSTSQEERKAEKPTKETKAGKDVRVLYSQAASALAAGDTSAAAEMMATFAKSAPAGDSLARVALLFAGNYWANHGKGDEILKLADAMTTADSVLTPEIELLRAKAYANLGRPGYALYLARGIEIKYAGMDIAKRAKAYANTLSRQVTPINIASPPVADSTRGAGTSNKGQPAPQAESKSQTQ